MRLTSTGAFGSRGFYFAAIAIVTWYGIVYLAIRPLTAAPVGDSWVYEHAVTHFNQTGEIQFPGYTQAQPAAQVLYGVAWSRLFGDSSRSLDIATALLGILGGVLFYSLVRRCGGRPEIALAATALLICNPCYLFLSFTFMTEVPFLAALLVSYVAFAYAIQYQRRRWLWLAAAGVVAGFAIRPFAATTLAGEAAALLIPGRDQNRTRRSSNIANMVPVIAALIACVALWIWSTMPNRRPWMLDYYTHRVRMYFLLVPVGVYLIRGVLASAIYLGIVLSPLALVHAFRQWRRSVMIVAAMIASSVSLLLLGHEPVADLTEINCFGGSYGALVLNGTGPHEVPAKLGCVLLVLGTVSFAGICSAGWQAIRSCDRVVLAVLSAAAIYWLMMPFLWFFADRYDLVLVPAACLVLALVPISRRPITNIVVTLMTAALAFVSVGGLASYHRSMQAIVIQTEGLLRQGIPRQRIDAGYSLNGRDLYVYPANTTHKEQEPPIPLIIGSTTLPYVIATSPIPNTRIWRRFSGCGPLGFGRRPLYVLKSNFQ